MVKMTNVILILGILLIGLISLNPVNANTNNYKVFVVVSDTGHMKLTEHFGRGNIVTRSYSSPTFRMEQIPENENFIQMMNRLGRDASWKATQVYYN